MKCPHCGSPMGLEDEFCSFCGKPNEFAKKHQEDMKHYHKEFKETQEKVYKKTNHFAHMTSFFVILFVLLILNLAAVVFTSSSWDIGHSILKKNLSAHLEEHKENLETFLQNEDYCGFSGYFNRNSLYALDEFQEYDAVVYAADSYFNLFRQLADPLNASDNYTFEAENLPNTVRSITNDLDSIFNVEQNYQYRKEICLTEDKKAIIQKIQDQTTAILTTYGGLTLKEAQELPDLSSSRQQEILKRSLSK